MGGPYGQVLRRVMVTSVSEAPVGLCTVGASCGNSVAGVQLRCASRCLSCMKMFDRLTSRAADPLGDGSGSRSLMLASDPGSPSWELPEV